MLTHHPLSAGRVSFAICRAHQPARLFLVLLVSKLNVLSADHDSPPCWSAALSRALCLIHKQQGTSASSRAEGSKPRILCINGSPDVPAQYIATMNAIFSAQVLIARSVVNTHSHCIVFSYRSSGFVLAKLLLLSWSGLSRCISEWYAHT